MDPTTSILVPGFFAMAGRGLLRILDKSKKALAIAVSPAHLTGRLGCRVAKGANGALPQRLKSLLTVEKLMVKI